MATAGTNITSLAKPAVGVTVGPTWATDLNTSIDAVDDHDHSTNKGIRITPAAINVNADVEFNDNSATELKNLIFSTVTAATTSYSVYQSGGNLYWRNGAGTAVQITTGSTVNAGAGSIDGMTGTDAGATFVDGAKSYNFFCDSGNTDFGKMAHADLLLYKFSDDNVADTDYITVAASTLASGSSGTVTVPAETGTILTTNTSYAGAVINVATSASNYAINLKPHGTGHVVIGNGSATGKLTSNGAYDLILDTNSGTNSSSIAIVDAANGDIKFIPNGTGKILVGSGSAAGVVTSSGAHDITVSTNSGTNSSYITIVDAANGNINLVNNGTGEVVIGSGAAAGKITSSGTHDLVLDTNAGTNSGSITITDAANGDIDITPNGSGEVNLSKVDIDAGAIDGTAIGASSHTTGKFTTCDATTDFTIGGTVITDNTITDDGTLVIASTTATSFSDGNITHVGDLNCDSISVDDAAVGLDLVFGGATTLNKLSLTDNLADALNINQGGTSYLQFVTTDSGEKIVAGKDLETLTTTKIKMKGSFMQSSTHQSWVLGG